MKKIIAIIASIAVLFGFVACDNGSVPSASDEEYRTLGAYLADFGHQRVLDDIDTLFSGGKVDGLELADKRVEDGSIRLSFRAENYDFDGHIDAADKAFYPRLASGEFTITLEGRMDKDSFLAEGYVFSSPSGVSFSMADHADQRLKAFGSITAVLSDAGGSFVSAADGSKSPLRISVSGETIDIDDSSVEGAGRVKFGNLDSGTVTVNSHAVDFTELMEEIKDLQEEFAEAVKG